MQPTTIRKEGERGAPFAAALRERRERKASAQGGTLRRRKQRREREGVFPPTPFQLFLLYYAAQQHPS